MTGTQLEHQLSAREVSAAEPVLEVRGLCRHGEFDDIDLTVRRGEVVGLIGLIGAGRTELAHALIGMSAIDEGEVLLNGSAVRFHSIRDAIDRGVAYVSEDRLSLGLIQQQSIADNTVISVLDRILGQLGMISPTRQSTLVAHWIGELAVKIGKPADAVSTLSGGNQQRVVLAKWLATKPRLLILDCPTVGVDVGARAGIFRIIRKLADEGLAILLISDEVTEVLFNSERVIHMADGNIVGEYSPHTVTVNEFESRIYG